MVEIGTFTRVVSQYCGYYLVSNFLYIHLIVYLIEQCHIRNVYKQDSSYFN